MDASETRCYTLAAEAAAEIVSQKLGILLYHPVRLGCFSTETQARAAKDNLAVIQEFFSTQDEPSDSVEWLERLLRALYDAEEHIDKFHLREACRRHKALNMAARPLDVLVSKYMLSRDLSNMEKAMLQLCQDKHLGRKKMTEGERKSSFSSSHGGDPRQGKKLGTVTSFWDRQALMNFVCHATKRGLIMDRIRDVAGSQDVHKIPIVGEQGTGKTFLARWVYKEAIYLGFDLRAWVHVSPSMEMQELLFEILKQVDEQMGDLRSMNQTRDKLYKQLAKAKMFLIVLDDVQPSNEQLLQSLPLNIPYPAEGCIIITTRDNGIAGLVSPAEYQIQLKDLDHQEFQEMVARKLHRIPDPQSLTDDENKIIDRYRRLPLLYISLLGGLLSDAGETKCTASPKDDTVLTLSEILKLSINRLPNHLKPCFIYMALFPVASAIPTRRLVKLWLAEGLLDLHCYDQEGKPTRLPEDVGETFILALADRNMIDVVSWRADGSPKACQMLTSLYDMIRLVARSTGFLHMLASSKSTQSQLPTQPQERARVRWLAEHTSLVTDPDLNLDHIHSFLSFYPRRGILTKGISKFLRKLTSKADYSLLRVLDLEGVYKPSLQGVLHKLMLLRYLGLRSTVLDSIPREVADMHHLETLDIKHTNITSLPSSFWKARKLRHLHLQWFYINLKKILKARSNDFMALTQLQTLSGLVTVEVDENFMRDHMNCSSFSCNDRMRTQQPQQETP